MLTQARITFRLHRFTLLAVAAMLLLASVAALIVAAQLHATGVTPECLASIRGIPFGGSATPDCQIRAGEFSSIDAAWGSPLMGALGGIVPLAGLLAGVALVAREIEDRTAAVAWSLATSRTRWLFGRVAPVAAMLVVLFTFASIAATELQRARQPAIDPLLSFYNDSSRGLELIAIGMLVFALAVLVGSVLGRVLPALITAAVIGVLLVAGVFVAEQAWLPSQADIVDFRSAEAQQGGAYYIDQVIRLSSGELRSMMEFQFDEKPDGTVTGLPAGATIVGIVFPGSRHPFVDAVLAASMALIAGVLFVMTAFVVRRRRPS
jgi:hypothetical protein